MHVKYTTLSEALTAAPASTTGLSQPFWTARGVRAASLRHVPPTGGDRGTAWRRSCRRRGQGEVGETSEARCDKDETDLKAWTPAWQ